MKLKSFFVLVLFSFLLVGCVQPPVPCNGEVNKTNETSETNETIESFPVTGKIIFAFTDLELGSEYGCDKNYSIEDLEIELDGVNLDNGSGITNLPLNTTNISLFETVGVDVLVAESVVSAGDFESVHLKIERVFVTVAVGENTTIEEINLSNNTLSFDNPFDLEENETKLLEFDFDLASSLGCDDEGNIIFLPTIDLSTIGDVEIEIDDELEEEEKEIEIKNGTIEFKIEFQLNENGKATIDELEIEDKIEIEIDKDGESKVEIELDGQKIKFKLEDSSLEETFQEIESRTDMSQEEILGDIDLSDSENSEIEIKLEYEGEDGETIVKKKVEMKKEDFELEIIHVVDGEGNLIIDESKGENIEIEIDEEGKAEVDIELNNQDIEFTLYNSSLNKTLEKIESLTGKSRDEIMEIAEIDLEGEEEEEPEDLDGDSSEETTNGEEEEDDDDSDDSQSGGDGGNGDDDGENGEDDNNDSE